MNWKRLSSVLFEITSLFTRRREFIKQEVYKAVPGTATLN